jgi:hypothetical protein
MSKAATAVDSRHPMLACHSASARRDVGGNAVSALIGIPAGAYPDENRGRNDGWFCSY